MVWVSATVRTIGRSPIFAEPQLDAGVLERKSDAGFDFNVDRSPENFQRFVEQEVIRWTPIVQANDLKV
jgi:hypothetical protein